MRRLFSALATTALVAVTLPALAQDNPASPPPTPASPPQRCLLSTDQGGAWKDEKFERQEFREEMESIRKEHEELERASDKLLDKCINAQASQAAQCEQDKQSLHEWRERLHERMKALREKMEEAKAQRRESSAFSSGSFGGTQHWPHPAAETMPSVTVPVTGAAPASEVAK